MKHLKLAVWIFPVAISVIGMIVWDLAMLSKDPFDAIVGGFFVTWGMILFMFITVLSLIHISLKEKGLL